MLGSHSHTFIMSRKLTAEGHKPPSQDIFGACSVSFAAQNVTLKNILIGKKKL